MLGLALGSSGCGWDYTPSDNVLPSTTAESEDVSEDPLTETDTDTDTGDETGGEEPLPANYRFDCIDIKSLGDADEDENVFQLNTLQTTWASDISKYKLNILIDLLAEDPEAGTGTVTIRSGVGPDAADQCSQAESESPEFPVTFAPLEGEWAAGTGEQCAIAGETASVGTYTLEMGADERVLIYAEDDDGTPFNCSVAGQPDAIPIWAVTATISLSESRNVLAGTLNGCVVQSQALEVCSCLSVCSGNVHPDCEGCPGGAVPLGLLLGGIGETENCTGLMGEPAFDITLQFSAERLGDVPETCG